jgi:hypothetical protein
MAGLSVAYIQISFTTSQAAPASKPSDAWYSSLRM